MNETYPVLVAVSRADGSIENVQVGTAVRQGDGFVLKLGELALGPPRPAAGPPPARGSAAAGAPAPGGATGPLPTVFPNYGRSKGGPIRGASLNDLEFYANGARRSLADPSKARWHDKERALLEAIDAEIARQRGGGGGEGPDGNEPPPHGDEDAPF
jgi:hypothetical protein